MDDTRPWCGCCSILSSTSTFSWTIPSSYIPFRLSTLRLGWMDEHGKDGNKEFDATREPQDTHQATAAPQQPPGNDCSRQQKHHSNGPTITLDVVQGEQIRISHKIAVRTREHVDR